MTVRLLMIMVCVWQLVPVLESSGRESRNFQEETSNRKWIPQQRQSRHSYYTKHHERENNVEMKTNMSDSEAAPYAVGLEEALFYRQHYFRENDNKEGGPMPDRNYNKIQLRAHRMKIRNGHRVVPHHLLPYESNAERSEGYVGSHYKSSMESDLPGVHTTTTSVGIRGKFLSLSDQIKQLFARNQSTENARADAPSRIFPKHRKRSEFELIPIVAPTRKRPIAAIPHESEESEFVNGFIVPRIAQMSLQEKSSGKFDNNFHIICEKDEGTQHIQCRNSEINVMRKEEDSVMRSNPNSKTHDIPEERNNYQKFEQQAPHDFDYNGSL